MIEIRPIDLFERFLHRFRHTWTLETSVEDQSRYPSRWLIARTICSECDRYYTLILTRDIKYMSGKTGHTYEIRVNGSTMVNSMLFGFEGEMLSKNIVVPDDWLIQAYKQVRNKPGAICNKLSVMK